MAHHALNHRPHPQARPLPPQPQDHQPLHDLRPRLPDPLQRLLTPLLRLLALLLRLLGLLLRLPEHLLQLPDHLLRLPERLLQLLKPLPRLQQLLLQQIINQQRKQWTSEELKLNLQLTRAIISSRCAFETVQDGEMRRFFSMMRSDVTLATASELSGGLLDSVYQQEVASARKKMAGNLLR